MQNKNFFTIELNDNNELIQSIADLAKQEQIELGEIISGTGRIKNFEIITTGQNKTMDRVFYSETHNVSSISGSVGTSHGKISHKINVSATKSGYNSIKGQLLKAFIDGSFKIVVRKMDLSKIIEA